MDKELMDREHMIGLIAIFAIILFVYDQTVQPSVKVVDNLEYPDLNDSETEKVITINPLNESQNSNTVPDNLLDKITSSLINSTNTSSESDKKNQTSDPNNTIQADPISPEPIEQFAEADDTVNEIIEPSKLPTLEPSNDKVTYYFFHASYCATCQTMLPMINDVAKDHPTLNVQLIDLHSNSPYIKQFEVSKTAISVIVGEKDGVPVSGTKIGGYMNRQGIERFICTELNDEICNNL